MLTIRKITIIHSRKPTSKDVNKDLQWFSNSLGLLTDRDKEKSCFRIFIVLLRALKNNELLSSDEIAERSNLTRATVIHHMQNLINKGIVISRANKYFLREDNLEDLIYELKNDLLKSFEELEKMAKYLDKELGLVRRHSYIG